MRSAAHDQTLAAAFKAAAITFLTAWLIQVNERAKMGQARAMLASGWCRIRGKIPPDRRSRHQQAVLIASPNAMILTDCAKRLFGFVLGQLGPRLCRNRLGLGAEGRLKVVQRAESSKALAQSIEAANFYRRRHSSRSSHKQLSQRLRSSTSIAETMWKMRVPLRKRIAGATPAL